MLAPSVSVMPSTPPFQLSSELPSWLRLECCFVIGSTPDVAPLPRLRIFLICPVSLDTKCSFTPQYTRLNTVHHDPPVPPPEVMSKSCAAIVDKVMFRTVTHVRDASQSKDDVPPAKVPTKGTETLPHCLAVETKTTRSADARRSLAHETLARVALKWCSCAG